MTIGGSPSSLPDGSAQNAGDAGPNATSCGAVDPLLSAMSSCLPCIVATAATTMDCCALDQACSGTCATLVQCTQGCNGVQTCVDTCTTNGQDGLGAYQALRQCLLMNCATQCPALAQ